MAAKKTQGESGKNEQLANSLLKVAAELLKDSDASPSAEKKPAAKKSSTKSATAAKSSSTKKPTAAKKQTAKKPATPEEAPAEEQASVDEAKPAAAKKPAAKKSAPAAAKKSTAPKAKKPAEKKEPAPAAVEDEPIDEQALKVEEPKTEEQPVEEPKAEEAAPVEEPKVEEAAPVDEPKAEEPPVDEPKAEEPPVDEPKAEEVAPVEEPNTEGPKAEEPTSVKCPSCGRENAVGAKFCAGCGRSLVGVAASEPKNEPQAAKETAPEPNNKPTVSKSKASVVDKAGEIINKKKLPIFIIVNALFLVCAIFLTAISFNVSEMVNGAVKTHGYSLFTYFGQAAEVKALLHGAALNWSDGAYGFIGLLMVISMLLPLALIVKNIIIAVTQKNPDKKFNVYKIDGVIVFAFMLFYISISSFYGANVSAGPMISLIISILDLVFCIFGEMLDKKGQRFPWFSVGVIALVILSEMLFTNLAVYNKSSGGASYAYYGASAANVAGGFMFVTYLIAVCALILLVITQLWKLPKLVDLITPIAAAVCALITLIIAGAGKQSDMSMGGFVFGALFMILLAGAYIVFTLVPALNKLKVRFCDMRSGIVEDNNAPVAGETAAATVKCPSCGNENSAGVKFCYSCGKPLEAAAEQPTAEQATAEQAATEPAAEAAATEETGGLCPRCGTQNDPSAPYCRDCGTKLK